MFSRALKDETITQIAWSGSQNLVKMKYVKFKYIYIQKYARYLWNINIADFAVLGEELLDVVDVGAVGKPVHLQAYHP